MLSTYVNRKRFEYGIPSLDNLLKTEEIPDSFLMYDEQILHILQSAGISPADAYTCTKAIKKKKTEEVLSYKDRFREGFVKTLIEKEGATVESANKTVDQVWTIIENAASYMFCAAHAYSMACDSLYAAWLKAHYPYQFYLVMLKKYTEKGNKTKIAAIIHEMSEFWGIKLLPGQFYQDNRDWTCDIENKTISQSLSSMKFISAHCAQDLAALSKGAYTSIIDLFDDIERKTSINARQMKVLLTMNYFAPFGQPGKLLDLWDEFRNGENRITPALREQTRQKRLQALRNKERAMVDYDITTAEKVKAELEFVGLPLSTNPNLPSKQMLCLDVEEKYGCKLSIYSLQTGKTFRVRIRKDLLAKHPNVKGAVLNINQARKSVNYSGKEEIWVYDFDEISYSINLKTLDE